MSVFRTIPFLRISIPFFAGIILCLHTGLRAPSPLLLLFLFALATVFPFFRKQTPWLKILFMVCTDLFLFGFAVTLTDSHRIESDKNFYGNKLNGDTSCKLIVVVNEIPVEKERTVKCELKVLQCKTDKGFQSCKGTLIAYFKKNSKPNLKFGQCLFLNTRLTEITGPMNPGEFNYKEYMLMRQIKHVCFPDSGAIAELRVSAQLNPVWYYGITIKQFLLSRLKDSELSKDSYAICCALLTGYDDEISRNVMEAFSHSGTLHVLSVSGLHTGLIYLVLSFLFDQIDRKKRQKVIKFIFITVCLWTFALITGFSAPVLRAVIMFNLLGFGRIFFRNDSRNQINILLASAFIIICYNPFYICDIGFLLSYFALFGILFYQPLLSGKWTPSNRIGNTIWQNLTGSFAATLSTLPLTLYFFRQFPLWFMICNLVVVPATFVILMLEIFVILNMKWAAIAINALIRFLTWFIGVFDHSGSGYIDNIDFSLTDAFFLTTFIFLATLVFFNRSFRTMVTTFILLISWQVCSLYGGFMAKQESLFCVYGIQKRKAVLCKNKNSVTMDSLDKGTRKFHIDPHLASFNYPEINYKSFNVVLSGEKKILMLDKQGFWPICNYAEITHLVVSNNIKITETEFGNFKNLKILICDGTNNRYVTRQLEKLCSKFGIDFYSTTEKGAYITGL